MELISQTDYNRLLAISRNKQLISTEYLKDLGNDTTKFVFEQFFGGETSDQELRAKALKKLELLNLTYALPYKTASVKVQFTGDPVTNLEVENFGEQILSYVYGGYSVFVIDELDAKGRPIVNYYGSEQYIKNDDNEQIIVALQNDDGKEYLLIKTFTPGEIESHLYKLSVTGEGLGGKEVPLDTLPSTSKLKTVEKFGTDKNLIVRINDLKLTNDVYGDSQLNVVKSLLSSLDIELVNQQDQYIKHLQAKLVLQGLEGKTHTNKDGDLDIRNLEAIYLENGANMPQYLSNKNDLMTEVSDTIDKYVSQIATGTSIPLELFGIKGQTGTESTESKELRYSDFTKNIESIQTKLKKAYTTLSEVVVTIYPKYFGDDEFSITFGNVMPVNPLRKVEELSIAISSGFLSRETATKEYTGLTGEALQEELNRIQAEETKSIANNFTI